jgi:hydroxymethylpyrimidine pyrophosphatase-like HAD family hydrolase
MLNKMYNELDKANDKEDISSDIRLYLTDTKLTMMPTFLNKGKAVERFIETFKRDVEEDGKEYDSIETFAFGDNDLDLEMLEKVDHAYCEKSLADKLSKIRADFETFDTRCDKVLTDLIKEGA